MLFLSSFNSSHHYCFNLPQGIRRLFVVIRWKEEFLSLCLIESFPVFFMHKDWTPNCLRHSRFSQTYITGNIGINSNVVLPYICNFLFYLHQMSLVTVKLDIIRFYFKVADVIGLAHF